MTTIAVADRYTRITGQTRLQVSTTVRIQMRSPSKSSSYIQSIAQTEAFVKVGEFDRANERGAGSEIAEQHQKQEKRRRERDDRVASIAAPI